MKFNIILPFLYVMTLQSSANDKLLRSQWEKITHTIHRDLPQSAQKQLHKLTIAAQKEGSMPYQLGALLAEYQLMLDVSPDSATAIRERIAAQTEQQSSPVLKSIWQYAYGKLLFLDYNRRGTYFLSNEEALSKRKKIRELLFAPFSYSSELATLHVQDFYPLFESKTDSRRVFNDDLLSLLTNYLLDIVYDTNFDNDSQEEDSSEILTAKDVCAILTQNLQLYLSQGRRAAALRCEYYLADFLQPVQRAACYERLTTSYRGLKDIAAIYEEWADLIYYENEQFNLSEEEAIDRCVQILRIGAGACKGASAQRLQQIINRHEAPSVSIDFQQSILENKNLPVYPGHEAQIKVRVRNLPKIQLRFFLLKNVIAKQVEKEIQHNFSSSKIYNLLKKTPHQLEGVYPLSIPKIPAHRIFKDTITYSLPQSGVYVVELSGKGVPTQYTLQFCSSLLPVSLSSQTYTTAKEEHRWVDALSGTPLEELPLAQHSDSCYWYDIKERYRNTPLKRVKQESEINAQLFVPRSIYRPGQQIEIAGIVYRSIRDDRKVSPNFSAKLILSDMQGKELAQQDITTDEFGILSTTFFIPEFAQKGWYSLTLESPACHEQLSLRVEEYRRPRFKIELSPLAEDLQPGDSITLHLRALSMAGIPLENIKLDGTIEFLRNRYQDLSPNLPSDIHIEGTTDAEGYFRLPLTLGEKSTKSQGFLFHANFVATAPDGEQQHIGCHRYIGIPYHRENQPAIFQVEQHSPDHATLRVLTHAHALVRVVSSERIEEERTQTIVDSADFDLRWKESYGDGAILEILFVKNGEFYREHVSVTRPNPDKRLRLRWETFRDLDEPGTPQSWTLHLSDKKDHPVQGNIMARVYDTALNAFGTQDWNFEHNFSRQLPNLHSYDHSQHHHSIFYDHHVEVPQSASSWSGWNTILWRYRNFRYIGMAPAHMSVNDGSSLREKRSTYEATPQAALKMAPNNSIQIRKNFNETAYFAPQLRTNKNGEATLRFTLPESITTWGVSAFAHDKDMRFALLNDSITTRKLLHCESFTPRFLREGDQVSFAATVWSSIEPEQGTLQLEIFDATTSKRIIHKSCPFHIEKGKSNYESFNFTVPDGVSSLRLRFTAQGVKHSDGEEIIVPVHSRFLQLTQAVPFSIKPGEDATDKITTAKLKLRNMLEPNTDAHIETQAGKSAIDEVLATLPNLLNEQGNSTYDRAVIYYGVALAQQLRSRLNISDYELATRYATALDRLREVQSPQGGWAWYNGMQPSLWISTEIAILLARVQILSPQTDDKNTLRRTLNFLEQEFRQELSKAKNTSNYYLSQELVLRYLYIRRIIKAPIDKLDHELIEQLHFKRQDLTMLGKACFARMFCHTELHDEALLALQSLLEHSVVSEEMGRYFDSDRINRGSYQRILTQTYALEALELLPPQASDYSLQLPPQQLRSELRLWLLQSRRTQQWKSSLATTDAVFSLLNQADTDTDSLRWGTASATYRIAESAVQAKGSGFKLQRTLQHFSKGTWHDLPTNNPRPNLSIQAGEKLRWVYTLHAERDFDHVELCSTRPAGCESTDIFSGIRWTEMGIAYREVGDADNRFFIEHINKGTYHLTDEFISFRSGTFATGIATVRCVFAPEFSANTIGGTLSIKPSPASKP